MKRILAAGAGVLALVGGARGAVMIETHPLIGSLGAANSPVTDRSLTLNLGSFSLVINAGATLGTNAPALAAFTRAANAWASRISDPITVTCNADLGAFGNPNIIGSTSSFLLGAGFDAIRNAVVSDATTHTQSNAATVALLPTAATFTAFVPAGKSLTANINLSKANAKALGFAGLDTSFGVSDGTITFNQAFAFDYDRSNGVGAGLVDFETVAEHELGHLLGFFSAVDDYDNGATSTAITPLDLFRFPNSTTPTLATFTTAPRELVPGVEATTSDTAITNRMSTGVNSGDGRQASHWKDDALIGNNIGIMDPTLGNGVFEVATDADFSAMDWIGYDVSAVPEPGSLGLIAAGGLMLLRRRRQR